jgi:hypothetical protein
MIVSLLHFLIRSDLAARFRFGQMMALSLYCGFPAVLIASAMPAFDLDQIDYQTVYMFCFLPYFLVVINRLERGLRTETSEED